MQYGLMTKMDAIKIANGDSACYRGIKARQVAIDSKYRFHGQAYKIVFENVGAENWQNQIKNAA